MTRIPALAESDAGRWCLSEMLRGTSKILRQVIRKIVDTRPYETPATIDDPTILDEIADAFRAARIGHIGRS